jgi:hypothetical protein
MTTWTPVTKPSDAWTAQAHQPVRTFSPYTFSRRPVFDTGPTAGIWDISDKPAATWTPEV